MAHIKKNYKFSSAIPVKEFTTKLFDKFEEESELTRIEILTRTESELKFKGPFFRFAAGGFHYFNGISCGILAIKQEKDSFILERTFCYKEFFLISLAFTILPILFFFSPIYTLKLGEILITHQILSLIAFIIIWGVFFLGNILLTGFLFSKLVNSIKKSIMLEYINSHK